MLKSISFKKLAVLTAGLAIVLSSCGLQNEASESSDDATAAGKTKNFALLEDGQFCFDTDGEFQQALNAAFEAHTAHHTLFIDNEWMIRNNALHETLDLSFAAQIGGCPAPVAASSADVAAEAVLLACLKPEVKQAMIDGYKEQIAKTDYPAEWSEATITGYQDEMKRGLATTELTCTN